MCERHVPPLPRWHEVITQGCEPGQPHRGPLVWTGALVVLGRLISPLAASRAQAPGPESFAQEPRTSLELWSAIDYLTRTGQSNQAIPYLEKFTSGQPDDAALMEIRDKFGAG